MSITAPLNAVGRPPARHSQHCRRRYAAPCGRKCGVTLRTEADLSRRRRSIESAAREGSHPRNVRLWHEADVTWERGGVRFQGKSGHDADWLSLPSLTLSGHDNNARSDTAVLGRRPRSCNLLGSTSRRGCNNLMVIEGSDRGARNGQANHWV